MSLKCSVAMATGGPGSLVTGPSSGPRGGNLSRKGGREQGVPGDTHKQMEERIGTRGAQVAQSCKHLPSVQVRIPGS